MSTRNAIRDSRGDRTFQLVIYLLAAAVLLIVLYPIYYVIIASLSEPLSIFSGKVRLLPVKPNLEAYRAVMRNDSIWIGYRNTIVYTVLGTCLNVLCTYMAAYGLSRKKMLGRSVIMFYFTFTMFFNGGLIPTYLLVNQLRLINTIWVMILLNLVSVYNMIVTRTYLQSTIDEQLYEASAIDGCSDVRAFFAVAVPLSAPILAVLVLFYAAGHWNQYFNALIYLRDQSKAPLQLVLRDILLRNATTGEETLETDMSKFFIQETLKYAVIIVSSLPMLMLYPFLQRFFIKGMMIGAIKG